MKKILISLFFIALLFVLGEMIPRAALSSESKNLEESKEIFTQYSLRQAKNKNTEQEEKYFITGMKLDKISEDSGSVICMDYPIVLKGKYEAEIKFYTIFGLPYKTVHVNCEGTSVEEYL